MQGTARNEDLDDEIKKVPQKLNIPVQKSIEWGIIYGRKKQFLVSASYKDVKNTTGRDMYTISRYITKICLPNP
jgi:hypothetical protein